ncbi:MAG: 50S ribosomal protein L10 [Pseudomonadales bacterium]
MPLKLEGKQAIVAEVREVASRAQSAVLADYRGMTVAQMTDLRVRARGAGVYLKVVRNTLVRRAVDGTDFECLKDILVGPTLLAFAQEEPGDAARLIKDFASANDALEVKGVAISGQLLPGDQINRVVQLPTKKEAIAQLMGVMQAPVAKLAQTLNEIPAKFVRTVNEIPGKFVRTLMAVRDQKQ